MHKKCALIVDDSRTARQVLLRKLTGYEIDVVTVDSAANAIDYLYGNTPDAVFMDYEMPGMDGFQALKIIKSNPHTAMIPVMMYTSKAGGLALGEARALGAIGVLPKEVAAKDLDSVIEQLHLLPSQQSLVQRLDGKDEGYEPHVGFNSKALGTDNVKYLDQSDSQKNKVEFPDAAYDESVFLLKRQSRIFHKELESAENKLKDSINKGFITLQDEINASDNHREAMVERTRTTLRWMLLANLLLILLVGYLVSQQLEMPVTGWVDRRGGMETELTELKQQVWNLEASLNEGDIGSDELNVTTEAAQETAIGQQVDLLIWAANRGTEFQYGENPFNDTQVAWLSELADQLLKAGFEGTINLTANYGNFCLTRSETGALVLAKDQMQFDDCLFSTAAEAKGFTQSSYQTLGFANYLNSLAAKNDLSIEIFVESDEYADPVVPYPDRYAVKTAGEWNRVASQNQRILVSLFQKMDF